MEKISKVERLAVAGQIAPILRGQDAKTKNRRIAVTDKDGNITRYITLAELQERILERSKIEFDFDENIKSNKYVICKICGYQCEKTSRNKKYHSKCAKIAAKIWTKNDRIIHKDKYKLYEKNYRDSLKKLGYKRKIDKEKQTKYLKEYYKEHKEYLNNQSSNYSKKNRKLLENARIYIFNLRLSKGICKACGKNPHLEGKKLCAVCREKQNIRNLKYRQKLCKKKTSNARQSKTKSRGTAKSGHQ